MMGHPLSLNFIKSRKKELQGGNIGITRSLNFFLFLISVGLGDWREMDAKELGEELLLFLHERCYAC